MLPHIESHRSRRKPRIQQKPRHPMLRHKHTVHRRNQHPTTPLRILLILHPTHQKLRQAPRHLRPLRLLLRQKHLHIRIPPPQISHQRPIAQESPAPPHSASATNPHPAPLAIASTPHTDSPDRSPPAAASPPCPDPAAPASDRSRSTAAGIANCVAPRSAAKYPRRIFPLSSSAFITS